MDIPHKVQVKKNVWYTVCFVDRFDDPDQIGYCIDATPPICSGTRTIQILNSLTKKQKLEVFQHELLHAIEFEYKLKLPHSVIYMLQKPLSLLAQLNQGQPVFQLSGAAARRKRKSQRRKGLRNRK